MTIYTAHYRYRRDGELNDHYTDICARSKAEAVRIAKSMIGEDDKTWLLQVRDAEKTLARIAAINRATP